MRCSALLLAALVVACDDDATTTSVDGGADAQTEAQAPAPLRCTGAELTAADFGSAGVTITFSRGANPLQYTNNCATVKVGAEVRFEGSFFQHPLEPAGGDVPTPIPTVDREVDGGALVVRPDRAGTFGYQCQFHPVQMFGAIRVAP